MKKITILIIGFLALQSASYGQEMNEMDFIRNIFHAEKKSIVDEFMQMTPAEAEKFWPLYEAFETERRNLGSRRVDLLRRYASVYENITDEQADTMIKEAMDIQKKHQALLKKYYKKVKKALGARRATSFYQLEDYIATAVRFQILDAIPFVDE